MAYPDGREGSGIRINKYLSESGLCSRREADRLIESGDVTIDDETAIVGSRVLPWQTVRVHGEPVLKQDNLIYLALNKPAGITCTTDPRRSDNIIDYLGFNQRIFPVGRLDRDSEGLILLTNDGDIVNKILRAGNQHEKEYRVTVEQPISDMFLRRMAEGVPILGTVTRPCRIRPVGPRTFQIILTQGLNRQIRRMCEVCGYTVTRLVRTRVMNIELGVMRTGQYRQLTRKELAELRRRIRFSRSDPGPDDAQTPDDAEFTDE
jgi:23S rRNA pseudouridine2604 synthase